MLDRSLLSPGYMRLVLPLLLRVTKPDQFEWRNNETIAIHMPAPSPFVLDAMALANDALLDPDEVKQHATPDDPWATAWLKRNTAGLGPYQLTKNEPGVGVVLEATKPYWRPAPFFARIDCKFVPNESDRLLLLKRKAIDLVAGRSGLSPRSVKSFEGDKGLKIVTVPDTTCHWLSMNTTKPPFDKPEVRQAVNYAIPIQAIIPNGPVRLWRADEEPAAEPDPRLRRVAVAVQIRHREGAGADEAGRAWCRADPGGAGDPRRLAAARGSRGLDPAGAAAHRLHRQHREGNRCDVPADGQPGQPRAVDRSHWQSWINDPFYHLYFNFHSKAKATNTSYYSNPAFDAVIDANMFEPDAAKRLAGAKQAQKILIDDAVLGLPVV